jgi:hypothetical protein
MLYELLNEGSEESFAQCFVDTVAFRFVFCQKQRFEGTVAVEADDIERADSTGLDSWFEESLPAVFADDIKTELGTGVAAHCFRRDLL